MISDPSKKVFYLSNESLEKIKQGPHLAWDLFQATSLKVYVLRVDHLDLKLFDAPNSKNNWNVDFIPCYTPQHFCLLVKIDRIDIASQDRAYQNGGGLALLLATPKKDNQDTDEFTVFGICPFEERESLQWSRFFVYYKDVDLVFKQSKDGQIFIEKDGKSSYLLVTVPWKLAEPLTPFITKYIGLNLWAAQTIEAQIPVQFHMLQKSEKLIAEQQLRDYSLYEFEEPNAPQKEYEITYLLESKHLSLKTPGKIQVSINSPSEDHLTIQILINGKVSSTETKISKGINRRSLQFDTENLSVGQHQLQLEICSKNLSYSEDVKFWIYDLNEFSEIEKSINKLKEQPTSNMEISESIATLEYLFESSMNELEKLKTYLSFDKIQGYFDSIREGISRVKASESLFVKGKSIRLGLRSEQDNSLQPYSVYIPNTFTLGSGGLLVLLHGSGSNDTSILAKPSALEWSERTGMIVVAPFARGESHFFLPKEASSEIVELTEKMMKIFSIPKEKVVLGGFSMGGFGVIHTYLSEPDLYRNLMVISGSFKPPASEPDWSTDAALQKLATANLIIFHGDADLNVPYKEQKPIHEKLKKLNPEIEMVIAEGVGHQEAPEWKEKIIDFLSKVAACAP